MGQLSHPYMTPGKTIALTKWIFVGKVISLLFNMLSRFVITFLPRSKHLLISWLQSPSTGILDEMFPWYLQFSWRDLQSFPFYCFPLFLCTNHWGRFSYLSLLFFGTLHSNGYIFPFLLCFSVLFFSQLFVRPPQTAILLFCISFSWGWSWSLSPVQFHEPPSIVHQALFLWYNPLNLFLTATV